MARIRTIKPEFPHDETLGALSRDARYLFILIWTCADDHGRFRASGAFLKGALLPFDEDVTPAMVAGWLAELEGVGRVNLYRVNSETYGEVANWARHQRVDNAARSRIPSPPQVTADPGDSPQLAESLGESPSEAKHEESHGSPPIPSLAADRRLDLGPRTKDPPLNKGLGTQREAEQNLKVLGEGGEIDQEPQRVAEALDVLADRRVIEAKAKGFEPRSPSKFRAAKRLEMEREHGATLRAKHAAEPGWMGARLANYVDPQPQRVPEYVPEGVGNGAVRKNQNGGE